ncbi:MAG: Ldh family oxidoreductase [Tagaea sp.]|nr:Ldh family oxidoreductase [Tagaea sp.]
MGAISTDREHPRLASASLVEFCRDVFAAAGMPESDATLSAEMLVEADRRGVESHGVVRVPIYIERLVRGAIAAKPAIRIVRETRATAVIDGGNGMGQVVGAWAMDLAIRKSRKDGEPAFVSVRNSNHFGAAAWFAERAAAHDMIGFAYTIGGINHMTPWGGAEAILGNNPFAIALPAKGGPTVVLDMACSVAARGKIIVAAKEGVSIPEGWAVDRDGVPTTDARKALEGFVSPVGGPKGYALTLIVGLLSTMLSGAGFGSEVTHMYDDFENPQNIGHLFGVLPIAAFEDPEIYYRRMAKAGGEVRGVRPSLGVDRIFLPGEREAILNDERARGGIPIPREVLSELAETGRKFGIALPAPSN